MKTLYKFLGLLVILAVIWGALDMFCAVSQPTVRNIAVHQLSDDNAPPIALAAINNNKFTSILFIAAIFLSVLATRIMFKNEWVKVINKFKTNSVSCLTLFLGLFIMVFSSGCIRPYDVPEFAEVKSNETAFLIPLEGATSDQTKMNSLSYLEEHKIGEKRVQVIHRWNQTGRLNNDGAWIATVRLISVDRSQVTRQWQATAGGKGKDEAIWVESSDSVGFSMGFSCSAYIKEEDAATFLYYNSFNSLTQVMDSEIHARIQAVAAEVCARYPLDILRTKKQEVSQAVKDDVVPFFAKRGITITTVGMYGGMTYENANIQTAIDQTFIAEQEKVNAAAALAAQKDKNAVIEQAADAEAEATRRRGKGQADAKLSLATAEAQAVTLIAEATAKSASNTALIRMRELEVERIKAERWNGQLPVYSLGGTASTFLTINPATAAAAMNTSTEQK